MNSHAINDSEALTLLHSQEQGRDYIEHTRQIANPSVVWAVRLPSGFCVRLTDWQRTVALSAAIRAQRLPDWAKDAGVIYELT